NDLPMGICFADPNGRIRLCNRKMQELANRLLGSYPQIISELTAAVRVPAQRAELLSDGSIRLEDGSVFHFRLRELTVAGQSGWQQLTAQDVTEQYRINEQLAFENERLKKTNAGLQKMYDRMADDIREKESLELKVYIHDTIGRSLLTIQDIMQSGSETENKLKALKDAVGVLSSNRPTFKGTMDEVMQTAAEMGVTVKQKGYIPAGTRLETLAVAAARECVTNCLRHARGNEITVAVTELSGIYKICITNNGEKPRGKITEGSGLSSLRRSVEAVGGEMYVSHLPAFALIIKLPKKESYDD
ncbi:MAG: ATP-binding protein, partial [Acutalibacteraceae bacterium]